MIDVLLIAGVLLAVAGVAVVAVVGIGLLGSVLEGWLWTRGGSVSRS